jgi:predicted ATPase
MDNHENEKLELKEYSRITEVTTFCDTLYRARNDESEILVISGESGVGKNTFVKQASDLVEKQCKVYFIHGKFDIQQQNIPYLPIINALKQFFKIVLTEGPESINAWKKKLLISMGVNTQIIADVIPELELIIGKQPSTVKLEANEAQNRFYITFKNFLKSLGSREHPVILYLEDVQWMDQGSVNLLEFCLGGRDVKHLLLVCSERDDDLKGGEKFSELLLSLKSSRVLNSKISLKPLGETDLQKYMSRNLSNETKEITEFSKVLYSKTGGNLLLLRAYLDRLVEAELLKFDKPNEKWGWNIAGIEQSEGIDSIVSYFEEKISTLDKDSVDILKVCSAFGSSFDIKNLSIVSKMEESYTEKLLKGLVERNILETFTVDETCLYRFAHDDARLVAYSKIDKNERRLAHIKIGHALLETLTEKELNKNLFNVINHLNEALDLLRKEAEKIELSELNLKAGLRASHTMA